MNISNADVFWIETGAMQGEDRYILEIAEQLAEFFDEKQQGATTIPIQHNGHIARNQDFKRHTSDHFTPQWRIFLPTGGGQYSQDYYPDKVAKFEKLNINNRFYQGMCYDLTIRKPSHTDVNDWRQRAQSNGTIDSTGQGSKGREYGYY